MKPISFAIQISRSSVKLSFQIFDLSLQFCFSLVGIEFSLLKLVLKISNLFLIALLFFFEEHSFAVKFFSQGFQ